MVGGAAAIISISLRVCGTSLQIGGTPSPAHILGSSATDCLMIAGGLAAGCARSCFGNFAFGSDFGCSGASRGKIPLRAPRLAAGFRAHAAIAAFAARGAGERRGDFSNLPF